MPMNSIRQCFQNDRFSAGAGIELLTVAPGHATAKMTLSRGHFNGLGTVHGGAIFTLGDFTFAAAANSHGTVAVAINANITFMKAAMTGTLWAEAKEVSKNFKIGTYAVEIRDDAGDLVAQFQGLAYRKKEALPVKANSPARTGRKRADRPAGK
jgi:acyl-CoA thioesterase